MASIMSKFANKMGDSMAPSRPFGAATPEAAPRKRHISDRTIELAEMRLVPIGLVVPDPDQPRTVFDDDELDRLKSSIARHGLMQPIVVIEDDRLEAYRIVAGERRYRACLLAGLEEVSCKIINPRTPENVLWEMQQAENLNRVDLQPLEQARSFARHRERTGCTLADIAAAVDKSVAQVGKILAILDADPEVQGFVEAKKLGGDMAYQISTIPDADLQVEVARKIVEEKPTLAKAGDLIKRAKVDATARRPGKAKAKAAPKLDKERAIRVATAGGKVTLSARRGLSEDDQRAMLREALAILEGGATSGGGLAVFRDENSPPAAATG